MLQKLIEQAKCLSEARKQRDIRYDELQKEYLQFSGLIKDVWTEHRLAKRSVTIDDIEFTLNESGCSFTVGTLTKSILSKLYQVTMEYFIELEKEYSVQFSE